MLHTSDEFLRAIEADPRERTLRLAYADWLTEHDDPRGELIRVEEEMRALPVFADRFWELKPRRNQLRSEAGGEWCAKMRYGTECLPVFAHGIPDGWRDRWRLIREFTERWHWVPMPDVGGRQAEIAEAEARLGRTLPPSVREWVAFAHDLNPPDAEWLCVFRDPYQMVDVPGHPALSLLLQAEGDYHWAVLHDELSRPDPPIQAYHWDHENRNEVFVPDARNPVAAVLTEFVLGYAEGYTQGESGFNADMPDEAAENALRRALTAHFPPPTLLGHLEVYEIDNVLVTMSAPAWRRKSHLEVKVARPAANCYVPDFLHAYAHGGGSFDGMYAPDNRPDSSGSRDNPLLGAEDDIPL